MICFHKTLDVNELTGMCYLNTQFCNIVVSFCFCGRWKINYLIELLN